MATIQKKLAIVGDNGCGKTCLLIVFTKDKFPEVYVPRRFEPYVTDIEVDGKQVRETLNISTSQPPKVKYQVELALWDRHVSECVESVTDYDRRSNKLFYPDTHAILICYSIDSPGFKIKTHFQNTTAIIISTFYISALGPIKSKASRLFLYRG